MKIRNLHLKTLIIGLMGLVTFGSQAWAQAPEGAIEITSSANSAILTSGDATTIINMNMVDSGGKTEHLPYGTSNVQEIYVTSWFVNNGNSNSAITYNSSITGSGDITFDTWGGNTVNNTYNFNGDMSAFTGDISTINGGLTLNFTGAARDSVAGGGAITTTERAIKFELAAGDASISNSAITGHTINIYSSSVDDAAPTNYSVTSAITASNSFNIGARSHTTMATGSSLTLGDNASFFVSDWGSLNFAEGSSLNAAAGIVADGNISMSANSSLSLSTSYTESSFTLDTLNFDSASGQINLNVDSSTGYVSDYTYDLISGSDLSSLEASDFNVDLGMVGIDYSLQIVGNKLQLVINEGNVTNNTWSGADGATWSSADTNNNWTNSKGTAGDFSDGDAVSFTDAAGGSVNIEGNVSPNLVKVNSTGDYVFEGSGSIAGDTALIKEGSGKLSLNNVNTYTGGTILKEGTLSFQSGTIGSGVLSIEGGALEAAGGGTISFASGKVAIAAGADMNLNLLNTNVSVAGVSASAAHDVVLTGNGTLSYDNWTQVSSVDVAEGTSFHFTGTNGNSGIYKDISGEGRIITNSSASLVKFRTENKSATETFTGTMQLNTDAAVVMSMNHSTEDSRFAVEMGTGSHFILAISGSYNTIYLDGLKADGTGTVQFDVSSGNRNVDLELSEMNTFGGDIAHDRFGTFTVDSAGSVNEIFVLNGIGYATSNTSTSSGKLIIQQADVRLEDEAKWGGTIELAHANAEIIFNNSNALERTAAMGQITGTGTVTIESPEVVTFSAANSYAGETEVLAGSQLNLGHNDAAGTSEIKVNGGTVSFADGLSIDNDIRISNANSSLSTHNAGDTVTLTGHVYALGDPSLLTLNQGNFNFDGATIENVALDLTNGANLTFTATTTFKNAALTDITISGTTEESFTTTEGFTHDNTKVHTLDGLEDVFAANVEGTLTLALTTLAGFDANTITAFELEGVSDIGMWYGNIFLAIDGELYRVLGATQPGGAGTNVILYVPEPSTATLSLLALAGLLARRRRKQVA